MQIDVHTLENEGYSSFSDSEDEKRGRKPSERMGAHTEAQPWKRDQATASPAGTANLVVYFATAHPNKLMKLVLKCACHQNLEAEGHFTQCSPCPYVFCPIKNLLQLACIRSCTDVSMQFSLAFQTKYWHH